MRNLGQRVRGHQVGASGAGCPSGRSRPPHQAAANLDLTAADPDPDADPLIARFSYGRHTSRVVLRR